jgi:hypothetical protein
VKKTREFLKAEKHLISLGDPHPARLASSNRNKAETGET